MEALHTLTGLLFRDMMISGAYAIEAQKQGINELNVFPVPDGDTGTNMSMTMSAARRELENTGNVTVGVACETAASALLRGARGNSGVILSLLFRGIARSLKNKTEADGEDWITALLCGVDSAYKAVMKPAEGTILTVARESAQACVMLKGDDRADIVRLFEVAVAEAKASLARTPELLPVLKKAGVVDAGGKGYVVILEAMLASLRGDAPAVVPQGTAAVEDAGNYADSDEEINFTYCTEFIINREPDSKKDALALRAYLESIGDSVLVADEAAFIKVHVHTNNPDRAIRDALNYGYLTDIKIDNMRSQHEKRAAKAKASVVVDKPFGFVAVAAGKGIADLFADLGADQIVEGGQTMNPSTEDILSAVEATTAETVFVLPNNKNIILAAEQAVSLSDRTVRVLHTKTIPQGITAMLSFDPEADVDTNLLHMEEAADRVHTGLVTFAARDSDFDGHKIKKDEILALSNGKLAFTDVDPVHAAVKLTRTLADKTASYVTIIFGDRVTAEAADAARDQIAQKLGSSVEVNVINGGQPIYHFIIAVE
ncbi:MAG: DAK2 domain-containing protein [Clostridia bacterium]|nr:DAK2 domain-containing protein [Clostridia bacterium]